MTEEEGWFFNFVKEFSKNKIESDIAFKKIFDPNEITEEDLRKVGATEDEIKRFFGETMTHLETDDLDWIITVGKILDVGDGVAIVTPCGTAYGIVIQADYDKAEFLIKLSKDKAISGFYVKKVDWPEDGSDPIKEMERKATEK